MDLRVVAGAPESALDERTAAGLPAAAPPAPWTCRCDAIVWLARPPSSGDLPAWVTASGDLATWAAGSGLAGGARPLLVAGALISYTGSPVGRYREIVGLLARLGQGGPVVTVPFIAVDSPASLAGGRRNWALPKALAEFTGEPADGTMSATGAGWTVTAAARSLGPAVPIRLAGRLDQRWPDGRRRVARVTGRAAGRPALVRLAVRSGGSLADWLRPGQHLGMLLRQAEFTLSNAI
jgi:hypothetical protein